MVAFCLATEDALSEAIGIRLIEELGSEFHISLKLRKDGSGYLRSNITKFCQIAPQCPILIITDLDNTWRCPVNLIESWMGSYQRTENLLLRVAVREAESWLLADHKAMRILLGKDTKFPKNPDELDDPKRELLTLAKKASGEVRRDIIKEEGSVSSQGMGYNQRLCKLVRETWDTERAASRSDSLKRARLRLRELACRIKKTR